MKNEIIFDEELHKYTVDGKEIPSVTEVLKVINKPSLNNWIFNVPINYISSKLGVGSTYNSEDLQYLLDLASKEPDNIKNSASLRGRIVHKAIEKHIKGESIDIDKKYKGYIDAFLKWKEEAQIDLIESETQVYYDAIGYGAYCGTLDIIGKKDDKLYLIDIKTSKNFNPENLLQTAAYQQAYEVMFDKKICKRIIVKLDKFGNFESLSTDEFGKDYNTFLSALNLFYYINEFNN